MKEKKRFVVPVLVVALVAMVSLYLAHSAFADPIEVPVEITPNHLNLSTVTKPYINGHALLGPNYDPAEIEECSLDVLGFDVEATRVKVCVHDPDQAVALFDRQTVCDILSAASAKGKVTLTMKMVLDDGTELYGSDTIRVSK